MRSAAIGNGQPARPIFSQTSFLYLVVFVALVAAIAFGIVSAVNSGIFGGSSSPGQTYTEGDWVEVLFVIEDVDQDLKSAFTSAAKTWSNILDGTTVIEEDVPESSRNFNSGFGCGLDDDTFTYPRTIDGVGGILAQAGPCGWVGITAGEYGAFVPETKVLPTTGAMQFDVADLQNLNLDGRLESTVLHEMGHVLGIGTLWDFTVQTYSVDIIEDEIFTFVNNFLVTQENNDPRFTGTNGKAAYAQLGGSGDIPLEDGRDEDDNLIFNPIEDGLGTIDGHWKETTFDTELMTGFLSSSNPMSTMTIRSLEDLGYIVNTSYADSYTLPSPTRRLRGEKKQRLVGDVLPMPMNKVKDIMEHKINAHKRPAL